MDIQAGNSASPGRSTRWASRNRALAAKPLIQEEHGLGEEDTATASKAWAAFTGGGCRRRAPEPSWSPSRSFASLVGFARMEPADGLVRGGPCLRSGGEGAGLRRLCLQRRQRPPEPPRRRRAVQGGALRPARRHLPAGPGRPGGRPGLQPRLRRTTGCSTSTSRIRRSTLLPPAAPATAARPG